MSLTLPPPAAHGPGAARARRYGILGTFPPTECGIATFTAALAAGLEANGADVGIVRVGASAASSDRRVVTRLEAGSPASTQRAVRALDAHDVAIVQHEYGLYGGIDGDEVVGLIESLTVPSIVVAHTVLLRPSSHQRVVLEAVAAAASAIVVMTEAGRDRLCTTYDVDAEKVVMIPHGAAVAPRFEPSTRLTRPTILTWGLLGEGKGIEWAIDAMCLLQDLRPRPQYVIAGDTHPKVFAREGERYREMLVRRSWEQGVAPLVTFDRGYRDLPALSTLIDSATVVLLPYDSRDQVTSGVLVDAVAAGRPVVSTAFPHAIELLASGAGIVVPQRDPAAIAGALRRVLTEDGLATAMAAEAARIAPELGWSAVAGRYHALADPLLDAYAEVPA